MVISPFPAAVEHLCLERRPSACWAAADAPPPQPEGGASPSPSAPTPLPPSAPGHRGTAAAGPRCMMGRQETEREESTH